MISLSVATVGMSVASIFTNLFIMLPLYLKGTPFAVKLNLTHTTIVPFNLVRGAVLSIITIVIYKRISRILKG